MPMFIIHFNAWNHPDPALSIDLIPEDIRPYVVFNVALSVSDFCRVDRDPFSIVETWIRTCAEKGVWVMAQPSSGAPNNFSETDMEVYEYFYKEYPNFIGWNFCEQSWGFENVEQFKTRVRLFNNLILLADKYGGYLTVSVTQTMNTPWNNPIAMLKENRSFNVNSKKYKDHYILCEKQTISRGFYDMESICLGTYLSGYSGHYGIRFDICGWDFVEDRKDRPFPEAVGGMPILEHFMLTGQTVTDGPETVDEMAILRKGTKKSEDGYTSKHFELHPAFRNINIDLFRKTLDGTMRIPAKEEVLERSKLVMVQDISSGNDRAKYSTVQSLFTGLYAMDGEYDNNNIWLRSSGRYPTIPTIYKADENTANDFETVVKHSEYITRWTTQQAKVDEFNRLFPEEYTGDLFASRINNSWVTYHPDVYNDSPRTVLIPFKYNTCESLEITHSQYAFGQINEYADKLEIYLNNYCSNGIYGMRQDVIKINGSTNKPTYNWKDRDEHEPSSVAESWQDGVLTLTITHNGPLELEINCSGVATDRLVDYPVANIQSVPAPPVYMGPRQHECEDFEYKNIGGIKGGANENYTGMDYIEFGTNVNACIRKTINVPEAGTYNLKIRYAKPSSSIAQLDLYVNNQKVTSPVFEQTASRTDWGVNVVQSIDLNKGDNVIEFKRYKSSSVANLFLDNVIIESQGSSSIATPGYDNAIVIAEDYYTVMGQRVLSKSINDLPGGIYIIKRTMSDGSVKSEKIYK